MKKFIILIGLNLFKKLNPLIINKQYEIFGFKKHLTVKD